MENLWRDLRYGLRSLIRKPGFLLAAVLLLMLGIGVNTAIFTLLDAIFLRPVPLVDDQDLAIVYATVRNDAGEYEGSYSHSYPNYRDVKERSATFADLALYQWHPVNLTGGSEPRRVVAMFASGNYFNLLRLTPSAGRFFTPEEDEQRGEHPVAVLSYGSWQRLFGGDPGVVGREVLINGRAFTIVGVGPRGFKGTDLTVAAELWVPLTMYPEIAPYKDYFDVRGVALFHMLGRLAPGATLAQADAEMKQIAAQLEEQYPTDNQRQGYVVRPFRSGTINPESLRLRVMSYRQVLIGAALLVLFATCLNVAVLLLVRGRARGREIAMRLALGARRSQLVRQLLVEGLILFLAGGLASLLVARFSLDLLWRFRPSEFAPDALALELDAMVLGFALALALLTGLVFGLMPAIRAANPELVASLRSGAEREALGSSRGRLARALRRLFRHGLRFRHLLVAGQVALALAALIGAGLFQRNLQAAHQLDLGFDYPHIAVLTFAPGEQGYDEPRTRALYRRVRERLAAIPGVRAVGLSENRLLRGAVFQSAVTVVGDENPSAYGGRQVHRVNTVAPGFFDAVGIRITAGEDFDDNLLADGPQVAIVNRTMADTLWPGEDPIGKRFYLGVPGNTGPEIEVVGVAENAKYRHVHEGEQFFIYRPLAQSFARAMTVHVRTEGDPAALLPVLRRELQAIDPNLPLADVNTMQHFVDRDLWADRMSVALLSVFGLIALAVAMIGIYGVVSYAVTQRRHELGIRFALGAHRRNVIGTVMREAVMVAAGGLLAGLLLSVVVAKKVYAVHLDGVSPTDPRTYALFSVVLVAAVLLGSLIPARRAARCDPQILLRDA